MHHTKTTEEIESKKKKILRVRTTFELPNVIAHVLSTNPGFTLTQDDKNFDLAWVGKDWIRNILDSALPLRENQRVNHFRNFYELTRKDNLAKNLKRARRTQLKVGLAEEASKFDIFPASFSLPSEFALFSEEFKRQPGVFIMKPVGRSQGKGIFLVNRLSPVTAWMNQWNIEHQQQILEQQQTNDDRDCNDKADDTNDDGTPRRLAEQFVVQRYIERPLCIGGKKFDLRVYALVASYTPLVAYIYRSGFARFTFQRYTLEDISNTFIHLTNVAVQKHSDSYTGQCKWHCENVRRFMTARYGVEKANKSFLAIQDIVINTLLAVQSVIIQDKCCFELLGYDILLDEDLRPWVLEVNASPSMSAENTEDFNLKTALLNDALNLVDPWQTHHGATNPQTWPESMGGFDMIYNNGIASQIAFLGLKNPSFQPSKSPENH